MFIYYFFSEGLFVFTTITFSGKAVRYGRTKEVLTCLFTTVFLGSLSLFSTTFPVVG